jgi:hypothetical protein
METDKVNRILNALEATEANLGKLERIWLAIQEKIPGGVAFVSDPEYDDLRRQYADIVASMPAINGLRLQDSTLELNAIAQWRFDAREADELNALVSVQEAVDQPERDLGEYRFALRKKRRELVSRLVKQLVDSFDREVAALLAVRPPDAKDNDDAPKERVDALNAKVAQLDRLLGSLSPRPSRWSDLRRHLSFGLWLDIADVARLDWPVVAPALLVNLYGVRTIRFRLRWQT